MLRIALIGCGAIGTTVLELLQNDPGLQVSAIVVTPTGQAAAREVARRLAPQAVVASEVPAEGIDLLVEAAGHAAVAHHVLPALERGVACIVASIGALSAEGVAQQVEAAAVRGGTQVQLISGGIGAIDVLAAARIGGLDAVRYTGRKPPRAWKGTPAEQAHDLDALTQATVIFEGSARDAALRYPKNANVAAMVSLAGLGLDATRVQLIADPAVSDNIHAVEASGAFGNFELTMRNRPLAANPKTSALTVYSLVRAVRNRVAALAI
ncbi:aspartate dehydrogenase [Variovorax ginsengisoli]|uniref:L-aspartate dehydrogenase n=1 Tax=Variovorax ginsengisoli TaxID=363844 RepID=A0ABT9SFM5_9BURK|nr:aspartate dehydrogenase [Variovorax ginsengisoli]MDP9902177.1 aspartate dehydrogenase [Variovorax ginsengisoli]